MSIRIIRSCIQPGILETPDACLLLSDAFNYIQQIFCAARYARKVSNDDLIPGLQLRDHPVELRPVPFRARHFFLIDRSAVNSCRGQEIELPVERLIRCADAGVPYNHDFFLLKVCQKRIKNQFDFDTFFDTFSSLKKPVLTWSGESVSKTFVFDTLAGKKKSRPGSGVASRDGIRI